MHPLVICQNKLGFCISNVIVDVSEFACKIYNMELGILRDWGIEGWAMILTYLFQYIIYIALFTL